MKYGIWIVLAAAALLACGGKVLEPEDETEATGGSSGTGGSGGASGTGATGGSPGTGGTAGAGSLVSTCLEYVAMGLDQSPSCSDCFGNAISVACLGLIEPLVDSSGPCGAMNECANAECDEGSPEQLCFCLGECAQVGPSFCEARWTSALQCVVQACSTSCN